MGYTGIWTINGIPMKVNAMNADRELLSERQAADFLTLKPQTLATWRCSKRVALPYVRVGSAIRYRRQDLIDFLEAQTVRPEPVAV